MWPVVVLVAMLSLCGFYTMREQDNLIHLEANEAENLVREMDLFRQLVIDYADSQNQPVPAGTTIGFESIAASPTTRYWLKQQRKQPWSAYFDEKYIYIFSSGVLPVNISAELAAIARYSALAGVAAIASQSGQKYLKQASVQLEAPIPLPDVISTGSPVWIVVRKQVYQ